MVVFATPADPMGFRPTTRDVKAQSAAKENTSEARGGDRRAGVRRPCADLGSAGACRNAESCFCR